MRFKRAHLQEQEEGEEEGGGIKWKSLAVTAVQLWNLEKDEERRLLQRTKQ